MWQTQQDIFTLLYGHIITLQRKPRLLCVLFLKLKTTSTYCSILHFKCLSIVTETISESAPQNASSQLIRQQE